MTKFEFEKRLVSLKESIEFECTELPSKKGYIANELVLKFRSNAGGWLVVNDDLIKTAIEIQDEYVILKIFCSNNQPKPFRIKYEDISCFILLIQEYANSRELTLSIELDNGATIQLS